MARHIPFGYAISDASIGVVEREAEVVRSIYSLYIQGMSLKTISERLKLQPIPYAGDGRAWDKHMVKRILENPRYTGEKEYPPILPAQTAVLAQSCRQQRFSKGSEADRARLGMYRETLRCAVCGGHMVRLHAEGGEKRKRYWRCSDGSCAGHRMTNEARIDGALAELLNEIAEDFSLAVPEAENGYEKDEALLRFERETNELTEKPEADTDEVVAKLLELAAMRFSRCGRGDRSALTERIRERMALYTHSRTADANFLGQVVRRAWVAPDGSVTAELINGKKIEKKMTEKSCDGE